MEYQSGAVSPTGSIGEGWNLIKDTYWTYVLMTLVAFVILIAVAFILGLISNAITFGISAALGVAANNTADPTARVAVSMLPQLISLFISIFTNIIVGTLSGALYCGIFTALARTANTGAAEFGDLFAGFQKISACLIVAAVMSIVQFVIGLVGLLGGAAIGVSALGLSGIITKNGQVNPAVFGGVFLVIIAFAVIYIIVSLIIGALTSFVYPLIAERNLSGGQALLLSIKSGFANIGGLILLLVLLGLMAFAGIMVCLIGVLFVAPILTASLFAAYRRVFGVLRDSYQYNPPSPPTFGNQPGY